MNILVTGSEGVIAQQTISLLIQQGFNVTGVDNLQKYNKVNKGGYTFIKGDLTDAIFTNSLFISQDGIAVKYDLVIHFAAIIYGVLWYDKYPAEVLSNNILMTINLLNNHNNIEKFIYVSSSMVYECSDSFPSKEEDTDSIRVMSSDYGLSKYVCERLVHSYNVQHNLRYTIWRPFNVFDINEQIYLENGKGHVFSDLFKKIVLDKQEPLFLLGDGKQTRSFIDIRDVAHAIAFFSINNISNNKTYNIGTDISISIKELATLISIYADKYKLLPTKYNLTFKETAIHSKDVKNRLPDVNKLLGDFNWLPSIPLSTSIEDFILNYV